MAEITLVQSLTDGFTEEAHRKGCAHVNRFPAHMVIGTWTVADRHELAVQFFGDVARDEIGEEGTDAWAALCDEMLKSETKIVACTNL